MIGMDRIGETPLGRERPFLIVEAGVNHEGDLARAFEMIDAAADAGADMIKFQSYKAGSLASKFSPAYWDRNAEPAASQFELFRRFDGLDGADYIKLARRCEAQGIMFASTPFDARFVDLLEPLMPVYKVASADLTNRPLLEQVARKRKPVLLSLGASYLGEVEEAIRWLEQGGAPSLALLHCTLEYPTPFDHANLNTIPYLKQVFPDLTVGWSDHVPPDRGCHSLLTAWMLGADILEKHFTLDKSLPGNDHYHAMDPDDVREFLLLQWRVAAMHGVAAKTVSPFEMDARKYARRSLVVARDLPAGALLQRDDLAVKRPGTGIAPRHLELVVGTRLRRPLRRDEVLDWTALLDRSEIDAAANSATVTSEEAEMS
ncbi:MAG: N-acetylneuraminate synthase family protein [bacterium]